MALVEIFLSTSITNVTTKEYFVYTQQTLFNNSPSIGNTGPGGVMVERADWSNKAIFLGGEYRTVKDVVMRLHVVVARSTRPLVTSSSEEDTVKFNFADGYGISLYDRSLFDVFSFKGVPDPNRGGYFIGNDDKVRKPTQPIKGDYPADMTAGTNIFFVNFDIIEHRHIAGVKAPFVRVIDTERRLTDGILQMTLQQNKSFLELQFRNLVLDKMREIFVEIVAVSRVYVSLVRTGRVAITLKFPKF